VAEFVGVDDRSDSADAVVFDVDGEYVDQAAIGVERQ